MAGAGWAWAAVFASVNIMLSMVVEVMMRDSSFPHPSSLLAGQCIFSGGCMLVWLGGLPPGRGGRLAKACAMLPSVALFVVQHYTRLAALVRLGMPPIIVARHLVPLAAAGLEGALLGEWLEPRAAASLGVVAVGAGVFTWFDTAWGGGHGGSWVGSALLAAHVASTAMYAVHNRRATRSLPPAEVTLLSNVLAAPLFGAAALLLRESPATSLPRLSTLGRSFLALSAPLSLLISLAASNTQAAISATSFTALTNAVKVVNIACSIAVGGRPPRGPGAWAGFAVTVGGGVWYAWEQWRRSQSKKRQ